MLGYRSGMPHFSRSFTLRTQDHHQVVDVTSEVREILKASAVREGQLTVYTPHATAAVTINENDDPNIGVDFLRALSQIVKEHDGWLHDRVDNNAAAHIKSAIIGPSETIPIIDGQLSLGTWQNVFFVEVDGPRHERRVIVSIVS
jgi:secondary thiamine-phosphate synthase enzyme